MKKVSFVAILLLSLVCLFSISASASENWYEVQDGVLTIRLESDISAGHNWSFEIADPSLLELLTMEHLSDDEGNIQTFVASFTNFSGTAGETAFTLSCYAEDPEYSDTLYDPESVIHTIETTVTVDENGVVSLVPVVYAPSDDIQGYADLPAPLMLVKDITVSEDGICAVEFATGFIDTSMGEDLASFIPYNSASDSVLTLSEGAEILLPQDMFDPFEVTAIEDPAAWYASLCDSMGFTFEFYAAIKTDGEEIVSMEYIYVP